MRKFYFCGLSLGVLLSLSSNHANAQYPNTPYQLPSQRPAVSPWLNLNRQGASSANNYYNLVQPQFEFGAGIQSLQAQTQANRGAITGLEGGLMSYTTGHRTGFMTQSRYFMNNNSGAVGGAYRGPAVGNRPFGGLQNPGVGLGIGQGIGSGFSGNGSYGGIGQGYGGYGLSSLPR